MGIYLRGGVWWARWYEDGQVRRRSTGETDKAAAARELARLRADTERRHMPATADTLGAVLRAWAARAAVLHADHPRTVSTYRYVIGALARDFGEHPAKAPLEARQIAAWQLGRLQDGAARGTVNEALTVLGQALRWGAGEGRCAAPPAVKRLRQERRRVPKFLEAAAVAALIRAAEASAGFARVLPFLELAAFAGLRRDEARWLRWEDVGAGSVVVRAKPGWRPKSGEREVPIDAELRAALERHRARSASRVGAVPWVAPFWNVGSVQPRQRARDGRQWERNHLGSVVLALFAAAGVERPPLAVHTLHLLRGTYATNLLRGGADLRTVGDLLGHADLKTTALYLESTSESRRRAVAGLRTVGATESRAPT